MKPVVTEVINFLHELDLLEAHLDEHQSFMDRIIVVESARTYSGMSKPLYFEANKERFARFNIEHEVLPQELHVPIPASYGEDERKQWFDERRNNRERQQSYIFNKYKVDADYICNTDVDEIWDRRQWHQVMNCMRDEYCYIIPKTRRFLYYVDWIAGWTNNWRITKSSMDTHVRQRGTKRGSTEVVGWHFNSSYKDSFSMWMKGVGLAQSIGYLGWANAPTPDKCESLLAEGIVPFLNHVVKEKCELVMPNDDLSWLPPFMKNNKDLWLWLPEELREGIPVHRGKYLE
jgi:beta-1,4-mannosyl-glycoprotein beta-1,4-N-acetylglucosaminyltransferase